MNRLYGCFFLLLLIPAVYAQPAGQRLTNAQAAGLKGFGWTLALTESTILIGAPWQGANEDNPGTVFVYEEQGGAWQETGQMQADEGVPGDWFGVSLAFDGTWAAIGASGTDVGGQTNAGAVYLFERTEAGWMQRARLTAETPEEEERFGGELALTDDHLFVGVRGNDDGGDGAGTVYVFNRTGAEWTLDAQLLPSSLESGDGFGAAVAARGPTLFVGAPNANAGFERAGHVYVFTREDGEWTEQATIMNPDDEGGEFGRAITVDGARVLVGAAGANDSGRLTGAAFVFEEEGAAWTLQQRLTASDARAFDYFGDALALEDTQLIVGAWSADALSRQSGAAYVFEEENGTWTEQDRLVPASGAEYQFFGGSLALEDGILFVGASSDSGGNDEPGSVYVYDLNATGTAAEDAVDVPDAYHLAPAFPNPFNPATTIRYMLPEAGPARLAVYDLLGREVAVLTEGMQAAGTHRIRFDAAGLPSGTYLYRLEAGTFSQTRPMTLMK